VKLAGAKRTYVKTEVQGTNKKKEKKTKDMNKTLPTRAPSGYYGIAFRKTKEEKAALKEAKRLHKAEIDQKYGLEFSAAQRKKILNP
jgi:hypothetical protein